MNQDLTIPKRQRTVSRAASPFGNILERDLLGSSGDFSKARVESAKTNRHSGSASHTNGRGSRSLFWQRESVPTAVVVSTGLVLRHRKFVSVEIPRC